MKPLINLDELESTQDKAQGPFESSFSPISEHIGAQKLSYSIAVVPPGKKVCPFHNHRINEEMFLILEGSGTLRFGSKEYPLRKNDVIACPPGGRDVAHQIVNTSNTNITYLCLSTNEPYDICEYPDSDKIMSMVGTQGKRDLTHITNTNDAVGYFEGEDK